MASKYTIRQSHGHGKNVRGNKKTATIQVTESAGPENDGYYLMKQFRFTVGDPESRKKAWDKAECWINQVE